MLKNNLRFLGTGFLLSAILLTGYQLVLADEAQPNSEAMESVLAERDDYKTKYEEMVTDYNTLLAEKSAVSQEQAPEPAEPSSELVPFTVEEGQPSAVVLENLVKENFLSNTQDAEKYLVENGLLTEIRFGTYTLSRDMDMEEVVAVLTGR